MLPLNYMNGMIIPWVCQLGLQGFVQAQKLHWAIRHLVSNDLTTDIAHKGSILFGSWSLRQTRRGSADAEPA